MHGCSPVARLLVGGVALLGVLAGAGHAAPKEKRVPEPHVDAEVERLEIAREHFQKGEQLEQDGRLEAAFVEYELAEIAHPSPSLTQAKQRVRARLQARAAPQPTPIAVTPRREDARPLRRFAAPIVIAPLAIATLVSGGALLGLVRSDVSRLESSCSPSCAPSVVDPLRTREPAAFALLGVGAALAVTDVALWGVLGARHGQAAVDAHLLLDGTGGRLVVGGRF
jgi:hypothetical protein